MLERVTEIGFEELPFDAEETRFFLEQALGAMKLSADEVRLIHDLTSGWPASVQLLADHAQEPAFDPRAPARHRRAL
jgi:LuxR family maltose regulon positive regulatory protein